MKKFLLPLLVPILALGLACDDDDNDKNRVLDPGSGGEGGASASVYYPMKTNAYWVMNYTETENGVVARESENTIMIAGKETMQGKEYWKFVNESGGLCRYALIEDNVVHISFIPLESNDDDIVAKAAGIINRDEDNAMMDFNAGVGESWIIEDETQTEGEGSISSKWTGTYLGTEDITVPAGTFTNCRKYKSDLVLIFNETNKYEFITTEWLAPNVGVVKKIESNKGVYVDGVKTDVKVTHELKEYSIP